ncbi:hypothetical protein KY084_11730 [Stakelama sp. CBK3Z-3]|uniref:Uncharacterized protein n=2 Tax=Stakelama flava TaxID=2860338 RepID=A0ABS6XMU8_9SPHN|nr:hypothetical protein [Stakelama flava]
MRAFPAWAQAPAHSGIIDRHGFELSDIALFVVAVLGVWFARRALRTRFRRRGRREGGQD